MSSLAELRAMKVNDLKAMCTARGLDTSGLKQDLVQRLFADISDAQAATGDAAATNGAAEGPKDQAAGAGADDVEDIAEPAPAAAAQPAAVAAGSQPKKHAAIEFPSEAADAAPAKAAAPAAAAAAAPVAAAAAAAAAPAAASTGEPEDERRKARAARFGVVKLEDRLKDRAARFGLPNEQLDKEKKLKRAQRFDLPVPELLEVKKKQRAERFGTVSEDDKLSKRAERFASAALKGVGSLGAVAVDADEEARRKARAARFAAAS